MTRSIAQLIVSACEGWLGCKIYRDTLPPGTHLATDMHRAIGSKNLLTIFDAGAKIGQSASAYVRSYPNATVYSFEPVRSTFQDLVASCKHCPRIKPFQLAAGDSDGQIDIFVGNLSSLNSVLFPTVDGDRREVVESVKLDTFAAINNIGTVDLLKID